MNSSIADPGLRALLVVMTATLAAGCAEVERDPSTSLPSQQELLDQARSAECDSEAFFRFVDGPVTMIDSVRRETTEMLEASRVEVGLVSAPDLPNSQLHDCQRLISPKDRPGDPADSLPLVALFVSSEQVQAGSFAGGRIVADIINYGPGTYEPLGIKEGLSCLWLESPADPGGRWIAAIRDAGGSGCAGRAFERPPADTLAVEVRRVQGETEPSYPPTGRWMWDPSRSSQLIGIRCGNAWCQIGRGLTPGGDIASSRDVPGRFDEQLLSYLRPDGVLVLSNLMGRVEPGMEGSAAFTRTPASVAAANDTLHVATVSFDTLSFDGTADADAWAAYVDKFGLGSDIGSSYDIHLTAEQDPSGISRWQGRGPDRALDILARGHTHSGSGTVRWSWVPLDEGIWIPCDEGCCMATRR